MAIPSVTKINASKVVTVTPTLTASSAYSTGFQLGGILTLADVMRQDLTVKTGFCELVEITILDKDSQNAAIDFWFFNQSPTVTSTNRTAFSMTDANLVLQCLGVVSVGTTYSAAAINSVSTTTNLNKALQVPSTATTPTTVYTIPIIRATATYTTTTSLQFQFGFFLD